MAKKDRARSLGVQSQQKEGGEMMVWYTVTVHVHSMGENIRAECKLIMNESCARGYITKYGST